MTTPTPEQRMERMEAVHEIENIIGRYSNFHATNNHKGCFELSAVNTPGVRVELPFGIYEGREGLERLYLGLFGKSAQEPVGRMHLSAMTTRVIEVAGDLKTAKGIWMSPGHTTDIYKGDNLEARWRWVKYGCDFIKEQGKWKIWHLHVYGIFATPFYKSWVESQERGEPAVPPPVHQEYAPDHPCSDFWQYREDSAHPNKPEVPMPYATFDESMAY